MNIFNYIREQLLSEFLSSEEKSAYQKARAYCISFAERVKAKPSVQTELYKKCLRSKAREYYRAKK